MAVPTALRTDTAHAETAPRPRLITEYKPRVLQLGKFYPPHAGGMESHLEALCRQLKEKIDLEVMVAASNSMRSSEELIDGVKVAHLGRLFTLRSAPMCPTMVRRIRNTKADLVHIHWPNPTALLAYLASGHRGRLVITYHSDVVRQKVLTRIFDPILQRGLDRADAIIASSANYISSSDALRQHREKCRVIPFGIDTTRFERPDELEVVRLRKRFGPRMVLSVGRLVYYKGFEFLIDAMKSVNAHLVLVGSGLMEAELRARIHASGVERRVTLLTKVKDVVPFYHASEFFVLPSIARSEAFGIVQLEAMACGKPVINTELDSGVPFVSIDGVTGTTVPPSDSKALARAMNALLADPRRRVMYGEAAHRRVREQFSLHGMAERTLALYHEVLNSDVRPS